MILVDTSVWIEVLRDRAGRRRTALEAALDGDEVVLSRFHQLELLQGALDERDRDFEVIAEVRPLRQKRPW